MIDITTVFTELGLKKENLGVSTGVNCFGSGGVLILFPLLMGKLLAL